MKKALKTIYLGIMAGISIAFGGFLFVVAKALIPNQEIAKLVGAFLFPVGLLLVCFLGFNLFTGKIGYLFDNSKNYLVFLLLVYLGNFIGSFIVGFFSHIIFKNIPSIYNTVLSISMKKCTLTDFVSCLKIFVGSCLCGALVYLAVFCYKSFKNVVLKVFGIFVPIALFVYLGNDHCIANIFYFSFANKFTDGYCYLNLAVVTIGNSLGAIALNEGIKAGRKLFKNGRTKSC